MSHTFHFLAKLGYQPATTSSKVTGSESSGVQNKIIGSSSSWYLGLAGYDCMVEYCGLEFNKRVNDKTRDQNTDVKKICKEDSLKIES